MSTATGFSVRPAPPQAAHSTSEPDFVERLRAREPRALEDFFDRYFDLVYRSVRARVASTEEAEELTQDVFLKIHRSLPTLDPTRDVAPWVTAVTNNRVRDYWRSQRKLQTLDDEVAPAVVSSEQPGDAMEQRESEQRIKSAIYRLPMSMRSVLALRVFDELTFDTIAKILSISPETVRKRYSRALGLLRGVLSQGVSRP